MLSAKGNFQIKCYGLSKSGQIPFGYKIRRGYKIASPSVGSQIQSLPFRSALHHKERLPPWSGSLQTKNPCCPASWLQLGSVSGRPWSKIGGLGEREEPGSLLSKLQFSHLHSGKTNSIYFTGFLMRIKWGKACKMLSTVSDIHIISIQRIELLLLLTLLR